MTRDRVSYDANWNGRAFTVVDTGGWDPDARGMAERIAAQAEIAVSAGRRRAVRGRRDGRHHRRRRGRRQDPAQVGQAGRAGRQQGRRPAHRGRGATACGTSGWASRAPVSALHGRGSGDLLDAILAALPGAAAASRRREPGGPRRIAIVGKPNVGKSSLLNKLAGEERVVVDNVAGTTVDPVDELVELGGRTWRFIDTAGIRKRVKEASGHEYYASLRTSTAIDRAEVAVLVARRQPAALRAGPADPADRPRGRPRAGHRLQQVGPGRRGAPLLPRARDRARPGPGAVGAADQHHRPHRLARRPAGPGARQGARGLGDPGRAPARSTRSSAGWSPSTRTRCAAASSPRSCSRTQPSHGAAHVRAVHHRQARRVATSASSSAGCARSSASSARRSSSQQRAAGEAQALTLGRREPVRSVPDH